MNKEFKQAGTYIGWICIVIGIIVLILWAGYVFPNIARQMENVTSFYTESDYAEPTGFFVEEPLQLPQR